MIVKRGDLVVMVSLREGTRTPVIVESVDGQYAIVRSARDPDEGRWRVGIGFLVPRDAR